jgi:hypothetical protein
MISKRISSRKDGKSSASAALRYGEGLTSGRFGIESIKDKSHRTRLGNFGLVDDGVYAGRSVEEMSELLNLAATEMQANCDLNTRVTSDKKLAHFVISFNQAKPAEDVLQDTEDSMLSVLGLAGNHFASFLHSDNGYWHLHMFVSRIDKIKHLGNPLWQDKTIRDRVCREIEKRHGLERDNGMHRIDQAGQIIEISRDERQKTRDLKNNVSDRTRMVDRYSGVKSFQTWVNETRVGDKLKQARNWQELHLYAAQYDCKVTAKGAGYVLCPVQGKGGIQLSKIGLKNLASKFGPFEAAQLIDHVQPEVAYKAGPSVEQAKDHYTKWQAARNEYLIIKAERIQSMREAHKEVRRHALVQRKAELHEIRANSNELDLNAALSVAKMKQAVAMTNLAQQFKLERQSVYLELSVQSPGTTFREFLIREAGRGDNVALGVVRQHEVKHATSVSRKGEMTKLQISATITGLNYQPAVRLTFTHRIEPSGSVVYDLGKGRTITDTAISRRILLNEISEKDPEAIAVSLRFGILKFGKTLALSGSPEFQRLAVEVSVRERLDITFYDPVLETYRQKLLAEQQHKISIQPYKEQYHASSFAIQRFRQIPSAHIRDRLRDMSLGDMVLDTSRDVGTLRSDVPHRMEQQKEGRNHTVQRSARRIERTERIKAIAKYTNFESAREQFKNIPVVQIQPDQSVAEHHAVGLTAIEWAKQWAEENHKPIVEAMSGDGNVPFKIIYVGHDGVVLDKGRTIAIYPKPHETDAPVGAMVIIDKNMGIHLQRRNQPNELKR